MKIIKIEKNCMGTLDLHAKFNGMRKVQNFCVYPMHEGNETDKITIQSDTRIGQIDLKTGNITMSKPVSSGAYFPHLMFATNIDRLDKEELAGLKFRLVQTASKKAGNNAACVYTDNSGADKVSIF